MAALGSLGGNAALPPVLERLSDGDPVVRSQAILALDELLHPARPDGRAVDPLLAAFRARTATAAERAALVRLLGRSGAPRAAPALARVAREATAPALVSAALSALGDLGPGHFDEVLLAGLEHADGSVRGAAALALRRAGSPATAATLLHRLEHPRELDEDALGIALPGVVARSRDPGLAPRITALLARRRGPVRDALIEALSEVPGALARLAPLLASRDPADRRKAAEGLATRADAKAALRPLLRDRDRSVRAAAVWSLGTSAGGDEVAWLTAALRDPDAAVAANAAAALGRAGVRGRVNVAAPLCTALGDERAAVRQNALAALRLTRGSCATGSAETLLPATRRRRAPSGARMLAASEPSAAVRECSPAAPRKTTAPRGRSLQRARSAPADRVRAVLVYVVRWAQPNHCRTARSRCASPTAVVVSASPIGAERSTNAARRQARSSSGSPPRTKPRSEPTHAAADCHRRRRPRSPARACDRARRVLLARGGGHPLLPSERRAGRAVRRARDHHVGA